MAIYLNITKVYARLPLKDRMELEERVRKYHETIDATDSYLLSSAMVGMRAGDNVTPRQALLIAEAAKTVIV